MDLRELWQPNPEAIRRLRRERGWSRFALASRAGVSPHTLMRAEKGFALFPSTVRLIAQVLDKTPEELCLYSEDTSRFDQATSKRLKVLFRALAALDKATINVNAELGRPDLEEVCHHDVVVSLAASGQTATAATAIHGVPALVQHWDSCNKLWRRSQPTHFDEIRPVGNHQILAMSLDRVWDFTLDGFVAGTIVGLYTFRDDRIAVLQQSLVNLTFNGQPLGPGLPQHVGVDQTSTA